MCILSTREVPSQTTKTRSDNVAEQQETHEFSVYLPKPQCMRLRANAEGFSYNRSLALLNELATALQAKLTFPHKVEQGPLVRPVRVLLSDSSQLGVELFITYELKDEEVLSLLQAQGFTLSSS